MSKIEDVRLRNPFHGPLVTEVLEDPARYRKVFSERILVGETLEAFQSVNVVLQGAQGCGKSMILNLLRYLVISEWLSPSGKASAPLRHVPPYFGISINLSRAGFQVFGRRSVAPHLSPEERLLHDCASAADFINHFLLRKFVLGLQILQQERGSRLRKWLGLELAALEESSLVRKLSSWDVWQGYYAQCTTLEGILLSCEKRLLIWRSFLNGNIDEIPREIWNSRAVIGEPLHHLGKLLNDLSAQQRIPLFVIIDQYEELPRLNLKFGGSLQRLINTMIKARDPVVFYKIGARTHDWGTELRIWGSESRIEVQRDYIIVNLSDILTRDEDPSGWLFPSFAEDVAQKRITAEGNFRNVRKSHIKSMLGAWTPLDEAARYFADKSKRLTVLKSIDGPLKNQLLTLCGRNASALELRLAGAWVLQQLKRKRTTIEIARELKEFPWRRTWWKKERIATALIQLSSMANQKKLYYGWRTIVYLAGGNITLFVLLCEEIWDTAAKFGTHPLKEIPLPAQVQTDAAHQASEKWLIRDREESIGGSKRYEVLCRLGPSIHDSLIKDLAISNPGHTGFSLTETELVGTDLAKRLVEFLNNAVNWAVFEERVHTSKMREGTRRRKWYLHPLLSPVFTIPHTRVKEPYYAKLAEVADWIFGSGKPKFGNSNAHDDFQSSPAQGTLFPDIP